MGSNAAKYHRRSIRLRDYDYAQAGAYFVTICTLNRECLFGHIADGQMVLSESGTMVEKWWLELNNKFPQIETDAYAVMPNHVHGIIAIVRRGPACLPEFGRTHRRAPYQRLYNGSKQ